MKIRTNDIFKYITGDFEKLWDSLSITSGDKGSGGNFLFASQAIVLLEWICRLLNTRRDLFDEFSKALYDLDSRYFVVLGKMKITISSEFKLPSLADGKQGTTLLDIIYGQIRNGHSHIYHQNMFQLADGKFIGFTIMMNNLTIFEIDQSNRSRFGHLNVTQDPSGNAIFNFCPDLFFLDVKNTILKIGLDRLPEDFSVAVKYSLREIRVEDVLLSFGTIPNRQVPFENGAGGTGPLNLPR